MRKFTFVAVTALSLLAGCTTTQVTSFLAQVQSAAATACAFVPTIDTIINVASALGIPYASAAGAAVTTVTNAICSKVPPPSSARYRALSPKDVGPAATVGTVGGVTISGWRAH